MITFNPAALITASLLISTVISYIPTLFIIHRNETIPDDHNFKHRFGLEIYIIFVVFFTVLIYLCNIHAEYLNQYSEKYGQIYYIKVNGNEIYSTDLQISSEHIIVNDVNGNYYEIDRNQDDYKIEYKKYTQNK